MSLGTEIIQLVSINKYTTPHPWEPILSPSWLKTVKSEGDLSYNSPTWLLRTAPGKLLNTRYAFLLKFIPPKLWSGWWYSIGYCLKGYIFHLTRIVILASISLEWIDQFVFCGTDLNRPQHIFPLNLENRHWWITSDNKTIFPQESLGPASST